MRIKYQNARCVCCNKVSSEEISDTLSEQHYGSWTLDKDDAYWCSDCLNPVEEVMTQWAIEDELKEKGI